MTERREATGWQKTSPNCFQGVFTHNIERPPETEQQEDAVTKDVAECYSSSLTPVSVWHNSQRFRETSIPYNLTKMGSGWDIIH